MVELARRTGSDRADEAAGWRLILTRTSPPAEGCKRPLAIGRGAWLFTGSPAAGEAAAVMFGLIGSATRRGCEPRGCLEAVVCDASETAASQGRLIGGVTGLLR